MIFDLLRQMPAAGERADVCVMGAGAAGIVLALELRRLGKTVLLLEGGGAEIEEGAQEPYRSEVVGHVHRGVHEGRFRAKGGTTTRWGGQIKELDAVDFARREWIAASGWPLTREEFAPYYERALALEGLTNVEREDAAVWRALDVAEPAFAEMALYLSRWCPEPNFARLHGKTLESDDGLKVWLHASCVEMLMEGECVRAVRCRTQEQDGREAVFVADAFVFALGTIECCRFFLQPREGELPWNRSGLLGKHFQDHIDANVAKVVPRDAKVFHRVFDNIFLRGFKYHPKVRLKAAEQERTGVLNVGATMQFVSDADEALAGLKSTAKHLMRRRFGEVSAHDVASAARHAPLAARQVWRYAVEHRAYNPAAAKIALRVHCEQRPDAVSSITLSGERDSLGMLRTRLDWRIDPLELRTIRCLAEIAARELGALAEVRIAPALLDGAGEAFAAKCDDSNHHMGGMRMDDDAGRGVVDTKLRLHGTRNVFVCSGAVFPTSGYSNPTHTVLALAVRLAEELG